MPPLLQELLSMFAKDIGHFEPMFSHRLLPSPSGIKISRIASSSNGLCVACTLRTDRKSTRLNSSHLGISYAVFCLKKKNTHEPTSSDRAASQRRTAPRGATASA